MRGRGLITLVACGVFAAPAPALADVEVKVGGNAFTPAEVTITEGESVNWVWTDGSHSVTSVAMNDQRGSFDSGTRPAGHKFSHQFEFDGRYEYFCKVHSSMRGAVVVKNRVNSSTPPPIDVAAPVFGTPRISVRKRRVKFTLDEAASVTARLRGPTRRTLNLEGKAGPNVLKLPKRLKPGRYALTLRATDADGNESDALKLRKFRVRKPR